MERGQSFNSSGGPAASEEPNSFRGGFSIAANNPLYKS